MRSLATPVRIEAYKCWYAFTLKVTGIAVRKLLGCQEVLLRAFCAVERAGR
jgi:hypothetical protein